MVQTFCTILVNKRAMYVACICGEGKKKQKSLPVFYKKAVLKSCAKFIWKHLCWNIFLIKLQTCNIIKNGLRHRCFPSGWLLIWSNSFLWAENWNDDLIWWYLPGEGLTMFFIKKRLCKIEYGIEGSISNVDLGCFIQATN